MRILKCPKCENMVFELIKKPCNIMCCNEELIEVTPKTVDTGKEKHLPVVTINKNEVEIKVGEIEHPMQEAHFINLIILETTKTIHIQKLTPDQKPATTFMITDDEKPLNAYEYCNLHGLWKTEIK